MTRNKSIPTDSVQVLRVLFSYMFL